MVRGLTIRLEEEKDIAEEEKDIAAGLCAQLPETTAINEFLCTDEYP